MMRRPTAALGTITLSVLLLAGCAGDGLTEEERSRYQEAYGLEHEDWSDRPSLFRDLFGNEEGTAEADEERLAELEQAIRELEEQRSERADARGSDREPVDTDQPRTRVGLLLSGDADALAAAFRDVAPDHPVVLMGDGATRDSLAEAGCDAADPSTCAEALSLYPGLRAVLRVDVDGNELRWSSYDVVLDHEHATRVGEAPEVDGEVPEGAWRAFADQALIATVDRLDTAPWHARAFSRQDDGWAINAGRAAGLEQGQQLAVRGEPSIIRTPGGRPVAWRPGSRKGVVEVIDFAGDDVAIVSLVEGEGPGEEDVLVTED
ncbi:hypothetical protein QWY84_01270 [Aquisalimonas lutea]|uniref:hypothetical protein n=1 Tax=Aquisalimonas lutea TaxID=1327750 RepID=UPI0025B49517|nr:hypothetical protein [Aquisalimonas lutea]MDN3516229.1 hypothetical protein [Aquisalimonas lutea]